MSAPLADLMRPQTIDEVVGQSHILNKDGILYRIAQSGRAANLIFYGPLSPRPASLALVVAGKFYKLSGTAASTADIKEIISSLDTFEGDEWGGAVSGRDSIFKQKQQQTLLEFWRTDESPDRLHHREPVLLRLQRHHQPQHRL